MKKNIPQAFRVNDIDSESVALGSSGGGLGAKTGLYAIPVLTPDRAEKRQNGRRMKENGEDMFTITGQDKHGVFNGQRIRRLTPTECERLQGFEDSWTEYGHDGKKISDNQRYKMLGNAVSVPIVQMIFERLNLTRGGK